MHPEVGKHLCPSCLYRDGSCEGTSYGATVYSCHAYVLAQENIWCQFGFHDWDVISSIGKVYNDDLARECRRCYRVEIKLKGDPFWRVSSEEEKWEIIERLQKEGKG